MKIKYGYITDWQKQEMTVTASILVIEQLSKLNKDIPMIVEPDGTIYVDIEEQQIGRSV